MGFVKIFENFSGVSNMPIAIYEFVKNECELKNIDIDDVTLKFDINQIESEVYDGLYLFLLDKNGLSFNKWKIE